MRARLLTLAGLVGLLGLTGFGCKKRISDDMPICLAEVAGNEAVEATAQELPPELWYTILIARFDRQQMIAPEDATDCAGGNLLTPTLPPLAEGETPGADDGPRMVAGCEIGRDPAEGRLPARPLTQEDLVIGEGPNGTTLVWAQASHYEDGSASGPIALVQWTKKGVAVRGLGTLRAQTKKARLRLEDSAGQRLLVVESDRCDNNDKVCQRILKLLPLIEGRFATVPLKLEDGTCIGEAEFVLFDQYTSILPDGWERKFEIVRSVSFDGEAPLVAEQVVIRDKDPTQPEAPPQEFRDAAVDRQLAYKSRYFETRASLWEDMIANYGSVAHDAKAGGDEDE